MINVYSPLDVGAGREVSLELGEIDRHCARERKVVDAFTSISKFMAIANRV